MEKLSTAQRAAVLRCLIEGNSIASTTRITGVAKNTIQALRKMAGEACTAYHEKMMVNLPCKTLQLDEVWSYVGCKEKVKASAINEHPGDVWTWTAICADTKLIPAWRVGDRSSRTAVDFCCDLGKRFSGHVQVTSDGHPAYRFAVGLGFKNADYAMLVKIYGQDENGHEICVGTRKEAIFGTPDMRKVSTSYVERSNLTVRMTNRRFTRLTNAFSKEIENHCHALALKFMAYNFCRTHKTLKQTPAMAAGIADHQWSMGEVVAMIEAYVTEQEEADYEAAFSAIKWTAPRSTPKTYAPCKPLVPWYLDPASGGPNPPEDQRKPGVSYDD